MVAFLLAGDVPVQIIKDILAMQALALHGGAFMDLDIFWLGRALEPKANGYLLPEEPHARRTGLPMGRSYRYPTLAMMIMPKASHAAMSLSQMMLKHWKDFAMKSMANPGAEPVDWPRVHSGWMWNTQKLRVMFEEDMDLARSLSTPLLHCPWNIKLTMAMFMAAVADTTSAPVMETVLEEDYVQPSLLSVARHGVTVNLWARQWDKRLQLAVLAKCWNIRAINLGLVSPGHIRGAAADVEACLAMQHQHLIEMMGKPAAFTMLGFCYAMLESGWCQDLLAGGPQPGTYHPVDMGIPGSAVGQGPWMGPTIHSEHWVGLLLLLAMQVLGGDSCQGSSMDIGHQPGPLVSACRAPGNNAEAARKWARSLGCGQWGARHPFPVTSLMPWFACHYNRHVFSPVPV